MSGLEPLSLELIWLAIPAIAIAGMVHGTFGIGFPIVATPLLALFTDVLTAVLITLLPTTAVNLRVIGRGGLTQLRNIRPYLWIIPYALLGTLLGSYLLLWLDPRPFLLVLAFAILLYLNQDRIQRLSFSWVRDHTQLANVLFGLAAGLMSGMVNVMLPVLIILYMELHLAAATMVVIFNINFLTGKLTQLSFFSNTDIPNIGSFFLSTLWLVPVAMLSIQFGFWLNKRISEDNYLKILRGILWFIAGILSIKFIASYI